MVLDSLLVSVVAPGSAGAAASVAPPGSLTLQPDARPELAYIVHLGRFTASALQIVTPSGHDTTAGFTLGGGAVIWESRAWARYKPRLGQGETLSVTLFGSATAGQREIAALSIAYRDIPGAEWIDPDSLDSRIDNVTSASISLMPTTNGTWPTGTALSSFHGNLRPQGRYAVLGVDCGSTQHILGVMITGPDTGWYRQLWPAGSESRGTVGAGDLIPRIAAEAGIGVPVITGGNASQTMVGLVGNDAGTARSTTIYLALLK